MEDTLEIKMDRLISHLTSAATYAGLACGEYADALALGADAYMRDAGTDVSGFAKTLGEIMVMTCVLTSQAERMDARLKQIEEESEHA